MIRLDRPIRLALAAFYALLWGGGVVSYMAWGAPPGNARWTAPAFLALAGVLAVAGAPGPDRGRLLACGAAGLAVEALGVHTGFPFGQYVYTDTLAPLVLGVPVVMAGSWIALVGWAGQVLRPFRLRAPLAIPAGAALLTLADLLVDPVAAGPLGYWRWALPGPYLGIPLSNFAGWLAASTLLIALAGWNPVRNRWARCAGSSVVAFLTVVAFGTGVPLAGGAGLVALALDAAAALAARRLEPAAA